MVTRPKATDNQTAARNDRHMNSIQVQVNVLTDTSGTGDINSEYARPYSTRSEKDLEKGIIRIIFIYSNEARSSSQHYTPKKHVRELKRQMFQSKMEHKDCQAPP